MSNSEARVYLIVVSGLLTVAAGANVIFLDANPAAVIVLCLSVPGLLAGLFWRDRTPS